MERLVRVLRVPVVVQRSPEWFARRASRVTSSEASAVLGESKYESATDVLFRKFGLGRAFVGNAATRYGQHYEPEAIAAYCAALGRVSFEVGLIDYQSVHGACAELAFVAGSPDGITVRRNAEPEQPEQPDGSDDGARAAGLIGPRGAESPPRPTERALRRALGATADEEPVLLEVKCPFRRRIVHGTIPHHYYAQVQLNMFICGLRVADFVEYRPSPSFELNIVRVYPDEEWLARSLPVLVAFHAECELYAGRIETHPSYAKYEARRARGARRDAEAGEHEPAGEAAQAGLGAERALPTYTFCDSD
jgi:putative phage-type endonuclease